MAWQIFIQVHMKAKNLKRLSVKAAELADICHARGVEVTLLYPRSKRSLSLKLSATRVYMSLKYKPASEPSRHLQRARRRSDGQRESSLLTTYWSESTLSS